MLVAVTQAIAQGDNTYQRNGNKISFKTLMGRLILFDDLASGTTLWSGHTPIVRILVFSDRLAQGVYPTKANMLEDVNNALSFANWNNRKRFRIYYDKMVKLDSPNAWTPNSADNVLTSTGPYVKFVKFRLKIRKPVQYLATGETEAANGPGAIYMMIWKTNITGGITNCAYTLRSTYQDI